MFQPLAWLPGAGMLSFEENPVDCLFQGLVGACGISVLCSLMRVHLSIQSCSVVSEKDGEDRRTSPPPDGPPAGRLSGGGGGGGGGRGGGGGEALQFWCLAGLLSLVGSRVASLLVLEFSLRGVASWLSAGPEVLPGSTHLLLVQCQFSLGCALACTLRFLQEGAPNGTYSLLLAAGLSWLISAQCCRLRGHAARIYALHSAQRYCGVCTVLQTHGRALLPGLRAAVLLAFAVAAAASGATVRRHFLADAEALRFWTPLTVCYALLVFYMQEEQHRRPGGEALMHTVALRLGALLVLLLMVGGWTDLLHVLLAFLGEALCLLPSHDLHRPPPQGDKDEGRSSRTERPSGPEHEWRGGVATASSDNSHRYY